MPEDLDDTDIERELSNNAVLDACAKEMLHGRGWILLKDGKKGDTFEC